MWYEPEQQRRAMLMRLEAARAASLLHADDGHLAEAERFDAGAKARAAAIIEARRTHGNKARIAQLRNRPPTRARLWQRLCADADYVAPRPLVGRKRSAAVIQEPKAGGQRQAGGIFQGNMPDRSNAAARCGFIRQGLPSPCLQALSRSC